MKCLLNSFTQETDQSLMTLPIAAPVLPVFPHAKSHPAKNLRSLTQRTQTSTADSSGHVQGGNQTECSVYCWGHGGNGRLGTGDLYSRLEPVVIMHSKCKVTEIACGSIHNLLLLEDHRVFAWGEGQHGQLGSIGRDALAVQPQHVSSLGGRPICCISAGGLSSAAVSSDGTLLCWGDNAKGKLGLGSSAKTKEKLFEPTPISDSWDPIEKVWVRCHFTRVWLGKKHCAATEKNGRFLTWGENSKGQLGLGDRSNRSYPVYVQGLRNITQVSLGMNHSAAIDSRSALYTWGDAGEGRLGHGEKYKEEKSVNADRTLKERRLVDAILEPCLVEFFRAKKMGVISAACGDRFTVVVDSEGSVWSWGSGVFGQLGLGPDILINIDHPSRISPAHLRDHLLEQQNARYLSSPLPDDITMDPSKKFPLDDCESLPSENSACNAIAEETMAADIPEYHSTAMVHCGPSHSLFSNGHAKVWAWGRAGSGMMGCGEQEKIFWPSSVSGLTGRALSSLATSDYHSVAVVLESREVVLDEGYKLHQLSGFDTGKVMLASRLMQSNDSSLRFEVKTGPKPRYGESDIFKNVTGVTADGNILVHLGGKSEVVIDASDLQTSRALSMSTIVKEVPQYLGEPIQSVDPVMNISDRQLREEIEKPNFFAPNTRIGDYVPEWKSTWEKHSIEPAIHRSAESPNELSMTSVESPRSRTHTGERRKSFWKSMAVEDGTLHNDSYLEFVHEKKFRQLHAHSRSKGGSNFIGSPCSALLGTSRRVSIEKNESNPGPGAYEPRMASARPIATQETLHKPCGVGITLTSKRNQRDPRILDIVVKEVTPGGSVDQFNQTAEICLSPADVIIAIDGISIVNIFMARKMMMGNAGDMVHIRYRHRDSRTAISSYAEMTIQRSYGPEERLKSNHRARQAGFIGTDIYIGLGLQSPRFADQRVCDLWSPEQEQVILALVEDIRNKSVKDTDLLKNRHCMIPPLVAVKRVVEKLVLLHPEWKADVSRPGALLLLFRKAGLIQDNAMDGLGPGSYDPKNTAVHNWSEDKRAVSRNVTMANTQGPISWQAPKRITHILTAAEKSAKDEEVRRAAEIQAFGRHLIVGELEEMSHKDLRKFSDTLIKLTRQSGLADHPGPCHYDPDRHMQARLWQAGEAPIGKNTSSFKAPSRDSSEIVSNTPGPGTYDLRKEGLSWSGDFAALQGSRTHIYKVSSSPQRHVSPPASLDEIQPPSSPIPSIEATTRARASPKITMQGRYPFEPFLGLRKDSEEWLHPSRGPGPNQYDPGQGITTTPAITMHGREPIDYEKSVFLRVRFDHETNRWEQQVPGPGDYEPRLLNDGSQAGAARDNHKIVFGTATYSTFAKEEELAALPGPGHYDVPSVTAGVSAPRNSAVNAGYIGERPLNLQIPSSDGTPGPGYYTAARPDDIGSDRACIGASARAKYSVSSTWCARCLKDPVSEADRRAAEAEADLAVRPTWRRPSAAAPLHRRLVGAAKPMQPGTSAVANRLLRISLAKVQRDHPLSARADMRRGFSLGREQRCFSARGAE